jgi:hypothetical protein
VFLDLVGCGLNASVVVQWRAREVQIVVAAAAGVRSIIIVLLEMVLELDRSPTIPLHLVPRIRPQKTRYVCIVGPIDLWDLGNSRDVCMPAKTRVRRCRVTEPTQVRWFALAAGSQPHLARPLNRHHAVNTFYFLGSRGSMPLYSLRADGICPAQFFFRVYIWHSCGINGPVYTPKANCC